ncbi:MAG: corrinoid protein [Clostridia bacterium]|nr:corrinoid protein [Clostridia bacterium]MBQ9994890.1 corrinoid protein [Clostridia bacterium]
MADFSELIKMVETGKVKMVKELVNAALADGVEPKVILDEGLLPGMSNIGEKFKNNEVYVPEVLIAARAMNAGVTILKPLMASGEIADAGTAVIGTVKGDLHDIGKNLVKMMLEGKGINVVDLGVDVSAEKFVEEAIANNAQIICCSALLTTTMNEMENVVKVATEKGIRENVFIMVGGAPITQEYCDKIGADCYTTDAASASDAAIEYLKK